MKLGYILNFSAALMRDGVVRIVNCLDTDFDADETKKYLAETQRTQRTD